MMKIRKSNTSTKRNYSELKGEQSSSYHHTKTYKMKANNSSCSSSWQRVFSIGLLLQFLVNCGKFIYIQFNTIWNYFHFHFRYYFHFYIIFIWLSSLQYNGRYSVPFCFHFKIPTYKFQTNTVRLFIQSLEKSEIKHNNS